MARNHPRPTERDFIDPHGFTVRPPSKILATRKRDKGGVGMRSVSRFYPTSPLQGGGRADLYHAIPALNLSLVTARHHPNRGGARGYGKPRDRA